MAPQIDTPTNSTNITDNDQRGAETPRPESVVTSRENRNPETNGNDTGADKENKHWLEYVTASFAFVAALGSASGVIVGYWQWSAMTDSNLITKSALLDVQRAFVFVTEIAKNRAIDFSNGKTVGWNFNASWKNSGTTQAKNAVIRTSGRAFPQKIAEDYPFPESFDATEAFIGPQGTVVGGTMGVELSALEDAKAKKQFVYLWGSVEYDDIFAGTPRHRTEYCSQILVVGNLTTDTGNVFVMAACTGHNRSYDIDRTKQREEYKGPEIERLSPSAAGTKMSLPPKPL